MNYELWDVETGNCLGWFTAEDEALAFVRSLLDRYGTNYADALELGTEDAQGNFLGSSSGASLIARAEITQLTGAIASTPQ